MQLQSGADPQSDCLAQRPRAPAGSGPTQLSVFPPRRACVQAEAARRGRWGCRGGASPAPVPPRRTAGPPGRRAAAAAGGAPPRGARAGLQGPPAPGKGFVLGDELSPSGNSKVVQTGTFAASTSLQDLERATVQSLQTIKELTVKDGAGATNYSTITGFKKSFGLAVLCVEARQCSKTSSH